MILQQHTLTRSTEADTDIHDLTPDIRALLEASGMREGLCVVFTPGSTASISTIEFEPGAVADLKAAIARIAPSEGDYAHNARWGDGNGYSHVRSALLGPSVTVPVSEAQLLLGTWQQIILLDFDNRPRERRVIVQLQGR